MKLAGYEFHGDRVAPLPGLLVTLYEIGDHSKPLDTTYTDTAGRWYFNVKRAGTYDVCVQRLSKHGVAGTKWIVGRRVDRPTRYIMPGPKRRTIQGKSRP